MEMERRLSAVLVLPLLLAAACTARATVLVIAKENATYAFEDADAAFGKLFVV